MDLLNRLRVILCMLVLVLSGTTHADVSNNLSSEFSGTSDMRRHKRMGISTQIGGSSGMFGLGLELNLSERFSVIGMFGGGNRYQAFSISVKRLLGEETLVPYLGGGLSRWYSSSSKTAAIDDTSPSF